MLLQDEFRKKYRCMSTLSRKVGLDRKRLVLANTKCIDFAKQTNEKKIVFCSLCAFSFCGKKHTRVFVKSIGEDHHSRWLT